MNREPAPPRGAFLVLEGIDGSGTTSQAKRLVESLRAQGVDALFTHEPSSGPVGRLLRQSLSGHGDAPSDWATLALLFAADRTDHLQREVVPALDRGAFVVCDRYDLSSLAYQSATAGKDQSVLDWIRALNSQARRPDLTLVLDVEPDVAARRRLSRNGEVELFEREALQRKLAVLYRNAESLVKGDRLVHIDGNQGMDTVQAAIFAQCQWLQQRCALDGATVSKGFVDESSSGPF